MNKNLFETYFDAFLKVTGIVSFTADFIAIYLFIGDLVSGQSLIMPSQRTISLAIIVVLAFVFAVSLIRFSGGIYNWFFLIVGVVYSVYGAVLLGIATKYFVIPQANSQPTKDLLSTIPVLRLLQINIETLYRISDYFILSIIITIFCFITLKRANSDMRVATIPYIMISIFHIGFALNSFFHSENVPPIIHVFLLLEIIIISIFFGSWKLRTLSTP